MPEQELTGDPRQPAPGGHRLPSNSRLYGHWIPAAIVCLAALTIILIVLALVVLLSRGAVN
jgi:hypothetical protein